MGDDCHSGLDLNCNAGIKGLILIYIDATLHCCQCEWEWGPKEKPNGVDSGLQELFHFIEAIF